METRDRLLRLLQEFFELAHETPPEAITQAKVVSWDSLAMVQLIAELQNVFQIDFDLSEIESLRSYEEIRRALNKKGVALKSSALLQP